MLRMSRIIFQTLFGQKGVCSRDSRHLHPGVASTFCARDFFALWHAANLRNLKDLVNLDPHDLVPVIAAMHK